MTWAAQTVTDTLIALGHVRIRHNSNSSNPAPTTLSRQVSLSAINLEPEILSIMGFSTAAIERIVARFQTSTGTGECEWGTDLAVDMDASTYQNTELTDVDISQLYPKASTVGWRILYPKARIIPVNVTPAGDFKSATLFNFRILPIGTTAAYPWSFDANYTL